MVALADFDAPKFTEVFIDCLKSDENSLTFSYALKALGFTKSSLSVNKLREILQGDFRVGIKSVAAEALANLDEKEL